LIEVEINEQKVKLYESMYEWLTDPNEFDLDFLKEFEPDSDDIVQQYGETSDKYVIECSNARNWTIVSDAVFNEIIAYNRNEYAKVLTEGDIPIYIPNDDDEVYLVHHGNGSRTKYMNIFETEETATDYICERVEKRIKKLAGEIKNMTEDNVDLETIADNLNHIERLIQRFNDVPGIIEEIDYYIDVTSLPCASDDALNASNDSGNNPIWAWDIDGDILRNDPEKGVGNAWYVELRSEKEDEE
jgi:hypothetical protein